MRVMVEKITPEGVQMTIGDDVHNIAFEKVPTLEKKHICDILRCKTFDTSI
jgi:hypothetical protein